MSLTVLTHVSLSSNFAFSSTNTPTQELHSKFKFMFGRLCVPYRNIHIIADPFIDLEDVSFVQSRSYICAFLTP